jgi:hypothetical protein
MFGFALLFLAVPNITAVERTEGPLKCSMGRDYWLGFPHGYDQQKTYWLVAVAHGFHGNGGQLKDFTIASKRDDYIVVSPSYPQSEKDGFYQTLGGQSDKQLIDIFGELKKRFHLREKIFVYGFSGGSQFSHRFAMAHPELVIGCSAHSGGSWGPEVSKKALGIPFFVSCGLSDTASSTPGSPPRIECAEQYFKSLLLQGAFVKMRYWEGVGHHTDPRIGPLTAECYELATTGMYPSQRTIVNEELKRIDALIAADNKDEAKKALMALPKLKLPFPGKKKELVYSASSNEEKVAKRAAFVAEGLGGKVGKDVGKGAVQRELWIDDRNENEFGYNENVIARAALMEQEKIWLSERMAERMPLVIEKKIAEKQK